MAELRDLKGEVKKKIRLPAAFDEAFRPDLIKKAVLAIQSTRYQPKGTHPYAGIRTSAHSWGSGRGVSHVPRIKNGSRAARVPQARGGREAHPPKPEKVLIEKVNKKEKRKALLSAIAATRDEDLVRGRGHQFEAKLPVVIEEAFEKLERTSDVIAALRAAGTTILLTTHELGDVERLADRVAVLDRGQLVAIGTPADLTGAGAPRVRFRLSRELAADEAAGLASAIAGAVRVVSAGPGNAYEVEGLAAAPDPRLVRDLAAWCETHDILLTELRLGAASLEERYLELVGSDAAAEAEGAA